MTLRQGAEQNQPSHPGIRSACGSDRDRPDQPADICPLNGRPRAHASSSSSLLASLRSAVSKPSVNEP
jgi:hypothetical protein